jgi:hypothetical protein
LLGLAAEHFELAGDEAKAAEFHARAAEQAGQRFAHDRVLLHVGRALALLGDACSGAGRIALAAAVRARDVTLNLQARRDEQAADLDALERLAEAWTTTAGAPTWPRRSARGPMRMADWATQERAAREGMAFAARAGR